MTQKSLGRLIAGVGQLLLVAIVVLCCIDVGGISARGELMVPLWGYLSMIFTGFAMQFIGAAVPNMVFNPDKPVAK